MKNASHLLIAALLCLGAAPAPTGYVPGLGDLMTATVQPRHTKLWLAGRQNNWPLAAYEFGELKEALADVRHYYPRWKDQEIGTMVEKETGAPLAALEKAITDKNESAFIQAFNRLSHGCNACHTATGHPYLVVRAPSGSAFPDQDFRPRSPR